MREFTLFSCYSLAILLIILLCNVSHSHAKDPPIRKEYSRDKHQCIARFESNTGEPLYYTCPGPTDSEKKLYCCYLDKCCDYKEYMKQTEQQLRKSQSWNNGSIAKGAIGSALKVLLWIVFLIILFIVGCCCLTFLLCKKKKLFTGGIFSAPLPTQPPGPSPYAPPTNPYMAYQWPPETAPAPPPAYPTPAYPPYPSGTAGQPMQPPFNPNFK